VEVTFLPGPGLEFVKLSLAWFLTLRIDRRRQVGPIGVTEWVAGGLEQTLRLRKLAKQLSFQAFVAFDRVGVHLLPKHYYSAIPDYRWLRANRTVWMGRTSLAGVQWDLDQQLDWLKMVCSPYRHEVAGLQTYHSITRSGVGPGYGPIEAQVLHCFTRWARPRRIVEIGSGVSTACMVRAIKLNAHSNGGVTEFTSIEPFPNDEFKKLKDITHLEQPCQTVDKQVFSQLEAGDLLFIDSSHAVKVGSDVATIYTEIVPKLAAGVFIHIHDIFLPYIYPRDVLASYFGWQETLLILALLTNNDRLSVLACLSALHYDRSQELKALFPDYEPQDQIEGLQLSRSTEKHFPSSLWLVTR
jgi:hypothetical protein